MGDFLGEYCAENELSADNILKYVDEYSIFSHYIGAELELYTKYSSPLRLGDDDPSFSLYYSKYIEDVMYFKDQSTGRHGNVFTFVRWMLGDGLELKPHRQALLQINSDFGIGLEGLEVGEFKPNLIKTKPLKKNPVKIEITTDGETEEYLKYWEFLGIPEEVRTLYYASCVQVTHYIQDGVHKSIVSRDLTIGYEILGHYKIYRPFAERKFKFRNDYLDVFVEGALQLKYDKNFCIITKSTKDIMFFRAHFDWDSVAGKSENTPINPYFIEETLLKKYKYVFIWLDPDEAGQNAQQRYIDQYPSFIPIKFDDYILQKDPTDLYTTGKGLGQEDVALQYLEQLITTKI